MKTDGHTMWCRVKTLSKTPVVCLGPFHTDVEASIIDVIKTSHNKSLFTYSSNIFRSYRPSSVIDCQLMKKNTLFPGFSFTRGGVLL